MENIEITNDFWLVYGEVYGEDFQSANIVEETTAEKAAAVFEINILSQFIELIESEEKEAIESGEEYDTPSLVDLTVNIHGCTLLNKEIATRLKIDKDELMSLMQEAGQAPTTIIEEDTVLS